MARLGKHREHNTAGGRNVSPNPDSSAASSKQLCKSAKKRQKRYQKALANGSVTIAIPVQAKEKKIKKKNKSKKVRSRERGSDEEINKNEDDENVEASNNDLHDDEGELIGEDHEVNEEGERVEIQPRQKKRTKAGVKQSSEQKYAVFITNLAFTTTEAGIMEHFEHVSSVKNVEMFYNKSGKFRGQAVLELIDRESYEKALTLNKSDIDGRSIHVSPDKTLCKEKTFKILVSQLPLQVNVMDAKKHFSTAGIIKRFKPPNAKKFETGHSPDHQGTAVIEAANKKTYNKILKLDGSLLAGKQIRVQPFEEQVTKVKGTKKRAADEERAGKEFESPKKKLKIAEQQDNSEQKLGIEEQQESSEPDVESQLTVFVGNLPYTVTKEDLMKHFEKAGQVLKCRVPVDFTPKKRGQIGFVTMADEETLQKALALKGSKLDGRPLNVEKMKVRIGAVNNERMTQKTVSQYEGKSKKGSKEASINNEEEVQKNIQQEGKKKRFVLFLGNLPFTSTKQDVEKHFENVGAIRDIRFALEKESNKPRGIAYLELTDQPSYERALALHQSFLGGRRINVLYTSTNKKSPGLAKHKNLKLKALSKAGKLKRHK